jgi:hypothetical protein
MILFFPQGKPTDLRMKKTTQDSLQPTEERRDPTPSAKKLLWCHVEHCGLLAVSSMEVRFFCLGQFISHCYERLGRCNASPFLNWQGDGSKADDRFFEECAQQAADLVRPMQGFDNLDRARFFDIFLWASKIISERSIFTAGNLTQSSS